MVSVPPDCPAEMAGDDESEPWGWGWGEVRCVCVFGGGVPRAHSSVAPMPGLEFQPPKVGSHLSAPLSQAYKAGLLHGVADTEQAVSFLLKATHNFPFTLRNK